MSTDNPNTTVILRRFGTSDLVGSDLATIRDKVLGITQQELADVWGISRTLVSRWESSLETDRRVSDQYLGLLLRKYFFNQFEPGHDNDTQARAGDNGDRALFAGEPAGAGSVKQAA
jgi:hypothetical protein